MGRWRQRPIGIPFWPEVAAGEQLWWASGERAGTSGWEATLGACGGGRAGGERLLWEQGG